MSCGVCGNDRDGPLVASSAFRPTPVGSKNVNRPFSRPGRYELVCDEPWHYAAGMFDMLTVT